MADCLHTIIELYILKTVSHRVGQVSGGWRDLKAVGRPTGHRGTPVALWGRTFPEPSGLLKGLPASAICTVVGSGWPFSCFCAMVRMFFGRPHSPSRCLHVDIGKGFSYVRERGPSSSQFASQVRSVVVHATPKWKCGDSRPHVACFRWLCLSCGPLEAITAWIVPDSRILRWHSAPLVQGFLYSLCKGFSFLVEKRYDISDLPKEKGIGI